MALVVITVVDEGDGGVGISAQFEPRVSVADAELTPAQVAALRMIEAATGLADGEAQVTAS